MKKRILACMMTALLLWGSGMTAHAAEKAAVTFTKNEKIEYSGVEFYEDGTPKLGTAFEGIAPGETAEQTVTMCNENDKTVDFYLNAAAIRSLEESAAEAKGAGYAVRLTAGDAVLYDSNVGGYANDSAEGSKEGILEINKGALDGYILVGTLAQGESKELALSVFFDGEAMDNNSRSADYSNTFGQLGFSFQVAYEEPEGPRVIYKEVTRKGENRYVKKLVEILEERVPLAAVATGDHALVGFGIVILALGIGLVVISGRKKGEGQS